MKTITENQPSKAELAIVIHGGAGTILRKSMTPEKGAAYKAKLEEAIRVGYQILKNGGSSLDAGTNEHDASIMDGNTLNAGASSGTTTVRNLINFARKIMDNSPHVMLRKEQSEQ